jgi:hypothetical protein
VDDPTADIDNPGRPFDAAALARALADGDDPYVAVEREAIQAENGPGPEVAP